MGYLLPISSLLNLFLNIKVFGGFVMSRVCELSNKGVLVGNRVSHAKNRTKVRLLPNLQEKEFLHLVLVNL